MVASANAQLISAELAASLPRYDPLHPQRDSSGRWVLLLSIIVHLALLLIFWDTLIGAVIEQEETVTVRMMEQKPKLQRKVLAQRRIDTSVRRFKDITQPEVQVVKPVEVLDQTQRVQVDATRMTVAPKNITSRKVVTRTVNAFADVPQRVQPVEVSRTAPTVRQVKGARQTAGPRKLAAAGPRVTARAIDIDAPTVTRGQISKNAVEGDVQGARVAAIESGTSDRFLKGDGSAGLAPVDKDCMKDPVCREYLQMIQDRVYSRWDVGADTSAGIVKIRFQVDRGGSAHSVRVQHADDKLLGDSCQMAFRHASPFPPPPKAIHYLVTKGIIATFRHGDAP
jgi:outer membrane biosynthesis protein TonB